MTKLETKKKAFVVTGACGYVASRLVRQLIDEHQQFAKYKFILTDLMALKNDPDSLYGAKADVAFVQCDISNAKDVKDAIAKFSKQCNIVGVFHIAAYGLSGTTNLPTHDHITERTNICGTENLIDACIENSIENYVFTSSVNVAFRGEEIIDGDEDSHKWLHGDDDHVKGGRRFRRSHLDAYSWSKEMAEKITVRANGSKLKNGKSKLKTCSLRLAGVYGPGEMAVAGRGLKYLYSIFNRIKAYSPEARQDFVHIKNVNQALIKAMEALIDGNVKVPGEIFYVTDGQPKTSAFAFEPFRGVVSKDIIDSHEGGYSVSPFLLRVFALFMHALAIIFGAAFKLPFWGLTWMECHKITVTHYFSIEKAKRVLGYDPKLIDETDFDEIKAHLRPMVANYETSEKNKTT